MRGAPVCQVLSAKVKTGLEFGFPSIESGSGLDISGSDPSELQVTNAEAVFFQQESILIKN